MPRPFLWALVFCLVACDDEGRVVPFGQEGENPAEEPEDDVPPDEVASAVVQPLGGEQSVELEGATFSLENTQLHALYADDVDGDADRDALALGSRGVDGATDVLVIFGRREGAHIVTRVLSTQRIPACDEAEVEASFRESEEQRVASARLRCGEERVEVRFVIKAESTPRVRERLAVRDGDLTLSFPDIDEDQHRDLRAELTLHGHQTTLDWLDRAGGLSRVPGEPEATLAAIRGEESAHDLARALCGPDASIAVGGRWGLDCPDAATQGIRLDAALARAGDDLPRALNELASFGADDQAEFFERLELPSVTWRRIDHRLPETAASRHAGLSFANEQTLIDHSTHMSVPLDGSTATPLMGPAPIRAPGGEAAAVRSVSSRGSFHEINIGSAAPFHSPTTRSLSLPTPPAVEWLVLGWAPQGLLLFDGVERFLGMVSTIGQLTEEPGTGGRRTDALSLRALDAGDPLPAPFAGARTIATGETWVAETPYGVLRAENDTITLWRPAEWDSEVETLALALSPSGRRVALAREDGIFLMGAPAASRPPPTGAGENAEDLQVP